MFSLKDRPTKLCDGLSRREVLRVGGLSAMGLSLPNLLQARDTAPLGIPPTDKTFGRAKNVIFLYLAGGPPQHETFDPKPDAPVDIRGPFNPISTNVPGIQFCELLPRTAAMADKLAIVRSMATDDNTHSSSGHWVLTGYKYVGPNPRTIQPTDWPYFGSIIKRYKPSEVLPPLSTVWIPDIMRLNENVTPAGQTGGFMGSEWDPDRFVGDPSQVGYRVNGLSLGEQLPAELLARQKLLAKVEQPFDSQRRGPGVQLFDKFQQQAFDLLTSGKAQEAFAIEKEPAQVRERYGNNRWGQCVLLARRLVEAGVRLVHVQWPREPGDNAVDNPLWDTHAQNADRVEDVLCPTFDVGFSALIEDLDQRGLLDETLVVAIGEFGRTPKINGNGGRDHWGPVFSCALAGAGISGGQVYGKSDKQGGHPIEDRVQPGELTATMFHLLGVDYQSSFMDREGREHRLTEGKPLFKLLGTEPATDKRVASTGDVSRVPPFDPSVNLMQTDFQKVMQLQSVDSPSRPKGWRAMPCAVDGSKIAFGATIVSEQAAIGLHGAVIDSPAVVKQGDVALLAQEVRSPFAGTYTLRIRLRGEASSAADFDNWFQTHFACRAEMFQYTEATKNASNRKALATVDVQPTFTSDEKFETIELTKEFTNPSPGGNFSFGLGMGIALIVEKKSEGTLELAPGSTPLARLRVAEVQLDFVGKQVNEKVKV
ncbi:MAG: DUF1501 domain-containing protein [Planctomycetales bacterium]|nr:DUF1501 domain-containing protein [Planctomycetales bacterium]